MVPEDWEDRVVSVRACVGQKASLSHTRILSCCLTYCTQLSAEPSPPTMQQQEQIEAELIFK